MGSDEAGVCVFGPALYLTVTIEARADGVDDAADIHFHPGGQGFWIARMINYLGCRAELVSPVGGEAGRVLASLSGLWGMALATVELTHPSPAYVHDRRGGEREEIARSGPLTLDRHSHDDLYGLLLEKSLAAGTCVVPGRPEGDLLPLSFYQRLGADLASLGVAVVGDLHGPELDALLSGGPVELLKVSDEDLEVDGILATGADVAARLTAARELEARGAASAVVSSAVGEPTVAVVQGRAYTVEVPVLDAVDPRGSGDSMTAGLVVARVTGDGPETMLRFACAAGAANATRHGLGNVKAGVVDAIAEHVTVRVVDESRAAPARPSATGPTLPTSPRW